MKYSVINDLIDKNAPDTGYVLAYTRRSLIFKIYSDKSQLEDIFKRKLEGEEDEILEVHLFDANCEYRILSSESSRYEKGFVDHLADFSSSTDETYVQDIFLELKEESRKITKDKIKVLNHIAYTSEGMAFIDDYRLCLD